MEPSPLAMVAAEVEDFSGRFSVLVVGSSLFVMVLVPYVECLINKVGLMVG